MLIITNFTMDPCVFKSYASRVPSTSGHSLGSGLGTKTTWLGLGIDVNVNLLSQRWFCFFIGHEQHILGQSPVFEVWVEEGIVTVLLLILRSSFALVIMAYAHVLFTPRRG